MLARHLVYHLALAMLQATLVVAAMIDRSIGVGVVIGFFVAAVVSAVHGYREAALGKGSLTADPDVPDEEPHYS